MLGESLPKHFLAKVSGGSKMAITRQQIPIHIDVEVYKTKKQRLFEFAQYLADYVRFERQGTLGNLDVIEEIENES